MNTRDPERPLTSRYRPSMAARVTTGLHGAREIARSVLSIEETLQPMRTALKYVLAGSAAALVAAHAAQARSYNGHSEAGAGSETCAVYSKQYAAYPKLTMRTYIAWAQGFMTAVNFALHNSHSPSMDLGPKSFPISAQQTFLNEYCDAHPTMQYVDGVIALLSHLREADSR